MFMQVILLNKIDVNSKYIVTAIMSYEHLVKIFIDNNKRYEIDIFIRLHKISTP